jgi:hypothetical protein
LPSLFRISDDRVFLHSFFPSVRGQNWSHFLHFLSDEAGATPRKP